VRLLEISVCFASPFAVGARFAAHLTATRSTAMHRQDSGPVSLSLAYFQAFPRERSETDPGGIGAAVMGAFFVNHRRRATADATVHHHAKHHAKHDAKAVTTRSRRLPAEGLVAAAPMARVAVLRLHKPNKQATNLNLS
jgi:hypothetical protein